MIEAGHQRIIDILEGVYGEGGQEGQDGQESKPGAWTQEEIDAIMAGNITKLQTDDSDAYGRKWRMWVNGWPTEEQKQATPWETSI